VWVWVARAKTLFFLIPATTQRKASGIFIAPSLFGQESLANDMQTISALILIADYLIYGNFIL
jgi:hypothetical protein